MVLQSLIRAGARRCTHPKCRYSGPESSPFSIFPSKHFHSPSHCTPPSPHGTHGVFPWQAQHSAQFLPFFSLGDPSKSSIGMPSVVSSARRSFFALSMRSKLKEIVREPAPFAVIPRFSALNRQPVLRQLNLRRQCISTQNVTRNFKSFSERLTQPLDGMKQIAAGYREAASLQVEAFWKRNTMIFVGVAGVLACYLLWRVMFGIANMFVGFSEGMAKFGFLAMAAATVAFTGMLLKARFTINPDRVYSIAMRKLNMSAAALEVLGAPLTGTDMRAYVMSSGGFRLKKFKPKFGGRRCFLIFPIQGSERRGLVSAEVKKRKGQYDFKLLAIDVANPGADQRLYIIGDEVEYRVGGGLISQLRDPIVKAMAAQKEFEAQDEKEEEEEAKQVQARREKELKDEEARRKEEIGRLERAAAG